MISQVGIIADQVTRKSRHLGELRRLNLSLAMVPVYFPFGGILLSLEDGGFVLTGKGSKMDFLYLLPRKTFSPWL